MAFWKPVLMEVSCKYVLVQVLTEYWQTQSALTWAMMVSRCHCQDSVYKLCSGWYQLFINITDGVPSWFHVQNLFQCLLIDYNITLSIPLFVSVLSEFLHAVIILMSIASLVILVA